MNSDSFDLDAIFDVKAQRERDTNGATWDERDDEW